MGRSCRPCSSFFVPAQCTSWIRIFLAIHSWSTRWRRSRACSSLERCWIACMASLGKSSFDLTCDSCGTFLLGLRTFRTCCLCVFLLCVGGLLVEARGSDSPYCAACAVAWLLRERSSSNAPLHCYTFSNKKHIQRIKWGTGQHKCAAHSSPRCKPSTSERA